MKTIRIVTVSIVVASMLLMSLSAPHALASPNPAVLPPEARVQGVSLGEWLARMQQIFAIPEPINPIFQPISECYFARYGNVGIAPAYFDSGSSSCSMPAGMMLHVGVIMIGCLSAMGDGDTEEELRACAEGVGLVWDVDTQQLLLTLPDFPGAFMMPYDYPTMGVIPPPRTSHCVYGRAHLTWRYTYGTSPRGESSW